MCLNLSHQLSLLGISIASAFLLHEWATSYGSAYSFEGVLFNSRQQQQLLLDCVRRRSA